jgi:hypothetical protein
MLTLATAVARPEHLAQARRLPILRIISGNKLFSIEP